MNDSIKRRLSARGVLANEDWLNTCANDFRSSNEYAPGQERLEEYIFQKWLHVNLWDLRVSCFPPDLENQLKVTLNGSYTCQIVSVIDTGVSAYSQYQKIRKVDTTNLIADNEKDNFQKKWEPKSSRTLLLSITDGTQELVALEAERIPFLSINLNPGCKAMIKGPVICRRGFIILKKAEQIRILGGEVESFLIPNAYENILAVSLGLPVNENPQNATESLNELEDNQQERRNENTRVEVNRHANAPKPAQRTVARAPVQWKRPEVRPQEVQQPRTNPRQNLQQLDDFPDDDALMNIDLDQVLASQEQNTRANVSNGSTSNERNLHSSEQSRARTDNSRKRVALPSDLNPQPRKQPSPEYAMDIDEDLAREFSNHLDEADFSQQAPPRSISTNVEQPSTSAQVRMPVESQDSGYSVDIEDDDIVWLDDEDFAPLDDLNAPSKKLRTENQRLPEDGPLKVADVVRNISEGKYNQETRVKVKVKVQRVVETLNVKNNEWLMALEISDESAVLLVSVSSETITKMFGITPVEGAKKRKEAVTNLAVREELKKAFRRLETTLKELHCIFEVLINPGQRPRVVNIEV